LLRPSATGASFLDALGATNLAAFEPLGHAVLVGRNKCQLLPAASIAE
jgi:hypothetical protein